MNKRLLSKSIEDKTIVWFLETDTYLVLEPFMADILQQIDNKVPLTSVSHKLAVEMDIPVKEAHDFINDTYRNLYVQHIKKKENNPDSFNLDFPLKFNIEKYYKVDEKVFKVSYKNEFEEYLLHPRLSYMEIRACNKVNFEFQVFTIENNTSLFCNDEFLGCWNRNEIHYMQGKFSMKLVEKMHHKSEGQWLGVFHASAVGNEEKSILFLGDSGNGKSTSLALLQANGFTCMADDFVPVAVNRHVYSFPSGISIKENSIKTLLPLYPELENSAKFHFRSMDKIVRFLKPYNVNFKTNLLCNNLVFIKYDKTGSCDISIEKISKIKAFQELIPDSWISKKPKNVEIFLDWFNKLNTYQLIYNDNAKMIETVQKLFNDKL